MSNQLSPAEQDSFDMGLQLGIILNMARQLDVDALQAMVRSADRFDTVAPILDPTSWVQNNARVARVGEAAQIVLDFRRAIAKMDARHGR